MGLTQIFLFAVVLGAALASSRVKRVVGGDYYEPGEHTYSVSLWYMGDNNDFTENTVDRHHTCGGSLIAPSWVLSSADCFIEHITEDMGDLSYWRVVLGQYNQYDMEAEVVAQFHDMAEIFFPPQYDPEQSHGDLALIKLSTPADLDNPMVSTININEDMSCPEVGQECTVIGWGQTDEENYGYGAYFPREANVNVQSIPECKATYEQPHVQDYMGTVLINEENICAGVFPEGGRDACHGDSGGPLLCACGAGGEVKVAGTVSTGYGCGEPGYAGVYTNVAAFASWIRDTMEKY